MTVTVSVPAKPAVETIATFFVQGRPVPQPRARAVNNHGFSKIIEAQGDHKIHDWKHALRFEAKAAMAGRLPVEAGPLRVELFFLFDRPQALTKPKWREKFILCTNGKDCDNLAKAILDAFNGLIWKDDRIVSTLFVRKQYTTPGQAPGVRVGVFTDGEEIIPFWP